MLQHFRTWPRSRAKGLLQAFVQGPAATQHFVAGARWRRYTLPDCEGIEANAIKYGWTGGDMQSTTPYFDPLEALDFYLDGVPLPQKSHVRRMPQKGWRHDKLCIGNHAAHSIDFCCW